MLHLVTGSGTATDSDLRIARPAEDEVRDVAGGGDKLGERRQPDSDSVAHSAPDDDDTADDDGDANPGHNSGRNSGQLNRTYGEFARGLARTVVAVVFFFGVFAGLVNGVAHGIQSRFAAGFPVADWSVLGVVVGCVGLGAGVAYGIVMRPRGAYVRDVDGERAAAAGGHLWTRPDADAGNGGADRVHSAARGVKR